MEGEVKRRVGRRARRLGLAGLGAAGVGAAVGVHRVVVGRIRLRPDPDGDEPFGELTGRPLTVQADDGVPLHVEIDGPDDGRPTLVFCHGYTLNRHTWHYQRRHLTGARMVFWDQRSHGASGRSNPLRATIDQTGADLFAVLRATVRPGTPVVLVGHSMGGMTIMALAEQHPELFGGQVTGVGLINTSGGDMSELTLGLPLLLAKLVRPLTPGVLRGLGRRPALVERTRSFGADVSFMATRRLAFAGRDVSPRVVSFLEEMIRATPIDVIAEFYPGLIAHDKSAALDVLGRVPTVVLLGGADRLTPAEHGRVLAAAMPGSELVEVEDAGHVLPLEHPGVVTAALRRLVARAMAPARERPA